MHAALVMQALTFSHLLPSSGCCLSPAPVTRISGGRSSSSFSSSSSNPIRCASLSSSSSPRGNDAAKFMEASRNGTAVPLYQCIFSDQLTPILAYRCLVKENDHQAPSFLFESVEPGSRTSIAGRYSVVGAHPAMEIVAKGNKVTIVNHKEGTVTEEFVEDPFVIPRRISEKWEPQLLDELPNAFCGGWVGYFSYDTLRYVENIKLPFSKAPTDDLNLPDMVLGLYDDVVVFDHVEKKVFAVHWVRLDRDDFSHEEAYADGMKRLEILVDRLTKVEPPMLCSGFADLQTRHFGPVLEKSNMTSDAYKKAVEQAKEHILAGDVSQIFLSQRFERRTFTDPFEAYRAMRIVNPSPYMGYLQARGCILVVSSPEILTQTKGRKIVNRPLTGTGKRGKTSEEDEMLAEELLKDENECAQHIMLVDLSRNDMSKVAKHATVKVEKLMQIERYADVMRISSTVTGELCNCLTCWDALRVALPGGTVTGVPKVKAMELIDELETTRRGPYGGGFGCVSLAGDTDIALSHRIIVFPTDARHDTMWFYGGKDRRRREWVAYVQAGARIVADSDPLKAHQECLNKAAGLVRAIDLAESAFLNKNQCLMDIN